MKYYGTTIERRKLGYGSYELIQYNRNGKEIWRGTTHDASVYDAITEEPTDRNEWGETYRSVVARELRRLKDQW